MSGIENDRGACTDRPTDRAEMSWQRVKCNRLFLAAIYVDFHALYLAHTKVVSSHTLNSESYVNFSDANDQFFGFFFQTVAPEALSGCVWVMWPIQK